jgi:hypothetical protein
MYCTKTDDMKVRQRMLRIAAVIVFLHAAFHSIGAFTWKQAPDTAVAKLIDGMFTQTFSFGGKTVSLGLFYEGYGISMIFMLLLIAVLLWLFSSDMNHPSAKKSIITISLTLLALSITEWIYFFPAPAAFSLAAGLLAMIAVIRDKEILQ